MADLSLRDEDKFIAYFYKTTRNSENCVSPVERDQAFLKLSARTIWSGVCCFLPAIRSVGLRECSAIPSFDESSFRTANPSNFGKK